MDYQESLQYIQDCTKHGIKLGLNRIQEILKRLGNPQERFQTIHIAGTNGKGSTTAMFDAVLREAGYKTGCYTSPHLISYRERYVVNAQNIPQKQLAEIITDLKPILESIIKGGLGNPTQFEVLTAIAFEYFARQKIDLGIIEVGMGGRFDATNVLTPILSVITHIALDHQEYLGDTLEKIAFEKAGIIKSGIPVVIGVQEPAIEDYLMAIGKERQAPFQLASSFQIRALKITPTGTEFKINNSFQDKLRIKLALIGEHQAVNCLNLLAGLESLRESKVLINQEAILTGLAKVRWPGRLERIDSFFPLKLYLDGAHNPDGVKALTESIKAIFPGQKVDILIGILNNRPLREMAGILAEIAKRVIVTTVPDPKSASITDLASAFKSYGLPVISEPSPERALALLKITDNKVALATGSLYLIGYLRSLILGIKGD